MRDRNYYVDVFKDTLKVAGNEFWDETKDTSSNKTEIYKDDIELGMYIRREMNIEFVENGSVNTAYENADMKVALLNFADALKPCGLVENGVTTQEEDIARCSNLYYILTSRQCLDDYYKYHTDDGIYSNRIIYSRDVILFKEDVNYTRVEPKKVDIITSPSINGIFSDNFAYSVMSRRADKVVKSAVLNGRDCLILGAWGCGAFGQKPEIIARCFADALKNNPYFVKVVFAIKGDNNFKRFKDAFTEYYKLK